MLELLLLCMVGLIREEGAFTESCLGLERGAELSE